MSSSTNASLGLFGNVEETPDEAVRQLFETHAVLLWFFVIANSRYTLRDLDWSWERAKRGSVSGHLLSGRIALRNVALNESVRKFGRAGPAQALICLRGTRTTPSALFGCSDEPRDEVRGFLDPRCWNSV
jgi:hypothetical protein